MLKSYSDSTIKIFLIFLIAGLLIVWFGYSRRDEHVIGYIVIGLGLAALIIAFWTLSLNVKTRQVMKKFFEKVDEKIAVEPAYELFINENYFGQKSYLGDFEINWTKSIHVKQVADFLFFYQWKESTEAVLHLSKKVIGEEKYEEVLRAVQNKIAQLKSGK